jgi:hypothetical protein
VVPTRYPEAEVNGFLFVMFVSYGTHGEALLRGPDGGIGTLVWSTGDPYEFRVLIDSDTDTRFGSFSARVPLPLTSDREAAAFLRALLPDVRPFWEAWRRGHAVRRAS